MERMEERTDLLRAIAAGWWIVPVVLAAALGSVAYLTADEKPPTYEASAILAVVPDTSVQNENQVLRSMEILERRSVVSTLSRIPTSGIIRRRAALGLDASLDDLRSYRVDTSILPSTHLVRISVRGPDPELAERFANAVASRSQVEGGRYYRVFAFHIVDRAEQPDAPLEGGERRSYTVAGVLGLFVGVGGAYAVGLLRLA